MGLILWSDFFCVEWAICALCPYLLHSLPSPAVHMPLHGAVLPGCGGSNCNAMHSTLERVLQHCSWEPLTFNSASYSQIHYIRLMRMWVNSWLAQYAVWWDRAWQAPLPLGRLISREIVLYINCAIHFGLISPKFGIVLISVLENDAI